MLDICAQYVYIEDKHKTCSKGDDILNKKIIAERLIKLRGEKSREVVANACGISISALAMYEQGERIPRDDIKIRLAKFYESTVESIFFD